MTLTNQTAMGPQVQSPTDAWRTCEKLALNERTAFLPIEPAGLERAWTQGVCDRASTPNPGWTLAWPRGRKWPG